MGNEGSGGGHILIVEDSPEVAEAFALLLEQEGYRVSTSSNGREALALLRRERPQLVFVDLVMPVLNGLQLIEQMRKDEALNDIPVVAVTASMHRAHGVHTVKKPFAGAGLIEAAKFYCGNMASPSANLAASASGVS
jgi:two-component system, OmpR family, response regulator